MNSKAFSVSLGLFLAAGFSSAVTMADTKTCAEIFSETKSTSGWSFRNLFKWRVADENSETKGFAGGAKTPANSFLDTWKKDLGPEMDPGKITFASTVAKSLKAFHDVIDQLEANPNPSDLREIQQKFFVTLNNMFKTYTVRETDFIFHLYADGNIYSHGDIEEQTKEVQMLWTFRQDANRFAKLWVAQGLPKEEAPAVVLQQTYDYNMYVAQIFPITANVSSDVASVSSWFRQDAKRNPKVIISAPAKSRALVQSLGQAFGPSFDAKKIAYFKSFKPQIGQFNQVVESLYSEVMKSDGNLSADERLLVLASLKELDVNFLRVLEVAIRQSGYDLPTPNSFKLYVKGSSLSDHHTGPEQTSDATLFFAFRRAISHLVAVGQTIGYGPALDVIRRDPDYTRTINGDYHITSFLRDPVSLPDQLSQEQTGALGLNR